MAERGPRGGHDKCCTILIPIAGQRDVVIKDTEADLYVAIDRAVNRVERTLSRKLERVREVQHQRILVADIDADPVDEAFTSSSPTRWSN